MSSNYSLAEFRKWLQISKKWMNYLPPFRPVAIDLQIVAKTIRSHFSGKLPNALVLGATPEFRDLLHELGASVTVVDQIAEMIHAMNEFRIYRSNETVVVTDWFKFLPANKHSFDLILSDLTQGNIPFAEHADFYALVSEALSPGGIFIDRLFTFRDRSLLFNADEEFRRFAETPVINLVILNEMFYRCFVASDLVFAQGKADFNEFYSIMRKKYDSPVLRKCADLMEEYLSPDGAVWYYGKYWNEVSSVYYEKLKLVAEFQNPEPVYRNIPYIIVSSPK